MEFPISSIAINNRIGLNDACMLIATFVGISIQMFMFRPLYRIASQERHALLIIFYKSCCCLSTSLLTIFSILLVTKPRLTTFAAWIFLVISFKMATKFLVLLFTFSRFFAIMFPWQYGRIWKKRFIHIYALIILLISAVYGLFCAWTLKINMIDSFSFFVLQITRLPAFSILASIALYSVAIIKMLVRKHLQQQQVHNVEKDHIKLVAVCMASLTPMIIDQMSLFGITVSSSFILLINDVLMKYFDEFTLLLLCSEFRAMIKNDLAKLLCKCGMRNEVPKINNNSLGMGQPKLAWN